MSKQGKFYIALTILAVLGIVALEYTKPKKINWFPSYAKQHKIPFGTYVFHEQLERIFSKKNITDINRPPYEFLNENEEISGTYIFINNDVNFGEAELDKLLDWTAKGNTLFVASANFETQLLDTLKLKTSIVSVVYNFNNEYQLQLKNKVLDSSIFTFNKANFMYHFNKIDTLQTTVISTINNPGEETVSQRQYINTIKQSFGEGKIILSTFPQAYTNYFILNTPNHNYTAGLISYIDGSKSIYLDNYYKSGKIFYSSPLYIFLNTKELKWAYYIMLIGVLVYIIFEGKRKQRAIAIVKPLRNQTVDFTRTIANMYYEKGQHKDIAHHKIQHFLDYIRTNLHLNTNTIDDEFLKNLASRSNNTIDDTKDIFNTIQNFNNRKQLSKLELVKLNTKIETFKKQEHD
ncbi:MAG: DUF4350 domain-containing protein [Bacteroidetes bacterium]|nr:DUF4350 domain-containing protein [Bacteroidota bacterium]